MSRPSAAQPTVLLRFSIQLVAAAKGRHLPSPAEPHVAIVPIHQLATTPAARQCCSTARRTTPHCKLPPRRPAVLIVAARRLARPSPACPSSSPPSARPANLPPLPHSAPTSLSLSPRSLSLSPLPPPTDLSLPSSSSPSCRRHHRCCRRRSPVPTSPGQPRPWLSSPRPLPGALPIQPGASPVQLVRVPPSTSSGHRACALGTPSDHCVRVGQSERPFGLRPCLVQHCSSGPF